MRKKGEGKRELKGKFIFTPPSSLIPIPKFY